MMAISNLEYVFPSSFSEKFDPNELSLIRDALLVSDDPLLTHAGIGQNFINAIKRVYQGNSKHAQHRSQAPVHWRRRLEEGCHTDRMPAGMTPRT
jgi:hypothetical protein